MDPVMRRLAMNPVMRRLAMGVLCVVGLYNLACGGTPKPGQWYYDGVSFNVDTQRWNRDLETCRDVGEKAGWAQASRELQSGALGRPGFYSQANAVRDNARVECLEAKGWAWKLD